MKISDPKRINVLVTTGLGSSIISWGNMGDVAMLQAGLSQLSGIWPNAKLNVITDWPEKLRQFCPAANPIQAAGQRLWVGEELFLGRFTRFVPRRVTDIAIATKRKLAVRFPNALRFLLAARLRLRNRHADIDAVSAFSEAIEVADLVIVCGSGGFYDGCRDWNLETLEIVESAVQRGIPVALVGQHFGPLTDPVVIDRVKIILPKVGIVTLRGNHGAQGLLESFGVPLSRIHVTGDEAIELAYESRPPGLGKELGVNFRLRTSAETSAEDIELLRPVLQLFAREHGALLVPAPIAVDSYTCDYLAVKQLLQGFDDKTDGGEHLATPDEIIRQVGRCRVLVTCAYHAAVFALSQGIPVVALVKSRYFAEKFLGLEERFGMGCDVVHLDRPEAGETIRNALERAWQTADDVHDLLLNAAALQIKLRSDAYNIIEEMVARRQRFTPNI